MSHWLDRIRKAKAETPSAGTVTVDSPPVTPQTLLEDLQEPAQIWSDLLHAYFWVCANQAQAAPLLAEGKPVYLPAEIRVLRQLKERWPHSFAKKLRVMHQSKTVFGALVVDAVLPVDTAEQDTTGRETLCANSMKR
jgi:hypothetical protein